MTRPFPLRATVIAAVAALVLPLISAKSPAHEYYARHFQIVHPWTPESPANSKEVVLSMKIVDIAANDRLVGASTPLASSVELRRGAGGSDPGFALVKDQEASFGLKGDHLVLKDVKIELKHGYQYPLELRFENEGTVDLEFVVGDH